MRVDFFFFPFFSILLAYEPCRLLDIIPALYKRFKIRFLGHAPGGEAGVVGGPECGFAYCEEFFSWSVEEDHV